MTTGTCYLQYYIEYILEAQKRYAPAGRKLPLCIMTSNDTNDATVALLERNNYYGMDPSQVTIVQQGQGVPALMDNQARMAHVSKSEWFTLQTKPHGHGDIHILMHSNGVAQQWLNTGFKWMILFQDTNGLAFHSLPLMLGVSKRLGFVMNSMAVPRKAKQAVGGIALLTKTSTGEKRYVCVACPYFYCFRMLGRRQRIHHITSDQSIYFLSDGDVLAEHCDYMLHVYRVPFDCYGGLTINFPPFSEPSMSSTTNWTQCCVRQVLKTAMSTTRSLGIHRTLATLTKSCLASSRM